MIDRIKEIMEYKGMSSTQFADRVEVPRAVISHILSERNKPSLEVVTKIVSAFPDISMRWILLGEGEMLKGLVENVAPQSASVAPANATDALAPEPDNRPAEAEKVQPGKSDFGVKEEKEIEKIIILYTDKTFTAYKP